MKTLSRQNLRYINVKLMNNRSERLSEASVRRHRMQTQFIRILLCSATIATNSAFLEAASASEQVIAWKFDHVGFSYSQGPHIFLLVEDNGAKMLWDPESNEEASIKPYSLATLTRFTDRLSPANATSDEPSHPLKSLHVRPSRVHRWPDGSMVVEYSNPSNDRLSWEKFYEIFARGRSMGKFYIVTDQSGIDYKVSRFTTSTKSDSPILLETIKQNIGATGLVAVNLLPGGDFIFTIDQFSRFPCKVSCDYVVRIKSAPDKAVSVDDRVYLVPYEPMKEALVGSGQTLRARYNAVLHLIASAQMIPTRRPAQTVTLK